MPSSTRAFVSPSPVVVARSPEGPWFPRWFDVSLDAEFERRLGTRVVRVGPGETLPPGCLYVAGPDRWSRVLEAAPEHRPVLLVGQHGDHGPLAEALRRPRTFAACPSTMARNRLVAELATSRSTSAALRASFVLYDPLPPTPPPPTEAPSEHRLVHLAQSLASLESTLELFAEARHGASSLTLDVLVVEGGTPFVRDEALHAGVRLRRAKDAESVLAVFREATAYYHPVTAWPAASIMTVAAAQAVGARALVAIDCPAAEAARDRGTLLADGEPQTLLAALQAEAPEGPAAPDAFRPAAVRAACLRAFVQMLAEG